MSPGALIPPPTARRRAAALGVLVAVVACDQLTKALARALLREGVRLSYLGDLLRLELTRNPGAFLSLGAGLPPGARQAIFTWLVLVVVAVMLWTALLRPGPLSATLGAALVAAGGLGNLWDRLLAGGVVTDFLNVGVGPLRTGIFNVADMAIMAGVALLVWPHRDHRRPG